MVARTLQAKQVSTTQSPNFRCLGILYGPCVWGEEAGESTQGVLFVDDVFARGAISVVRRLPYRAILMPFMLMLARTVVTRY